LILSIKQGFGSGFDRYFKSLLFCCHTFDARSSIGFLDPENQLRVVKIRTGALGLAEDAESKIINTKRRRVRMKF